MKRSTLTGSILRSTLLVSVLLLCSMAQAQEFSDFDKNTHRIRIKKIANEWQGAVLTLHTRDGEAVRGRLTKVSGDQYHLLVEGRSIELPIDQVVKVSFNPGMPEALLTLTSAFLGAAFASGTVLILSEEDGTSHVFKAASIGLLVGGWWGYNTFYESEVIYLE